MRLTFDADQGCYRGATLSITGPALLRRIAGQIEAAVARGADPVDAAEQAWSEALEEGNWRGADDGVTLRSSPVPRPPT